MDKDNAEPSVDYRPMNTITQNLVDVGEVDDYSVYTSLREDKMHTTEMRIDYALVSKQFMEVYDKMVSAKTIKSDETSHLSDHYPLEIMFSMNK